MLIGESGQISTTALLNRSYQPRLFQVIHLVMLQLLQPQAPYWNNFFLPTQNSFNNWLRIVQIRGSMQAFIFVPTMKQESGWVKNSGNILLKPG